MKDLICNIRYLKGARVVFCDRDKNAVDITYKNVILGIRKALQFFSLKPGFPLVNIFMAPNRKEYDKLVAHLTKIPTTKGRIGQPQGHDLYILSPHAWPSDAHSDYLSPNGSFDKTFYRQFIEHEIVHMVEEYSSPKDAMEIRPQWWSEGLAVYATGQYRDRLTRSALKEDLAAGRLPYIAGLKGRDAYVWGWSLVRHIEKRLGRKKLREIMVGSCTGDILGFMKVNKKEFELHWRHAMPELANYALVKK